MKDRRSRQGAATIEFAMCLPVIVLLVLGSIEAYSMIFLKQSLSIAAYEGGRTALVAGATNDNVVADCLQVINDRGIQGAQVVISANDITKVNVGSYIDVEVQAPCDENSIFPSLFYGGQTLSGFSSVMKEY